MRQTMDNIIHDMTDNRHKKISTKQTKNGDIINSSNGNNNNKNDNNNNDRNKYNNTNNNNNRNITYIVLVLMLACNVLVLLYNSYIEI